MYKTSAEYKEMMSRDLRERSFVWVYLGLVNHKAQENVTITSDLADFGDDEVFGNSQFEAYYATAEENFSKTDGTFYFLPDDISLYHTLKQGAVTRDILGSITFSFSERIDEIGGLTIDFGDCYPTEFIATNGNDTYTYTNDKPGQFIIRDRFAHSDYITIEAISMVGGNDRLRIHTILFGLGFVFDNTKLISTKRTNVLNYLATELPQKTFEFTIDNLDQEWTIDNPDSYAYALQEKQVIQVTYGRELDDGSIFRIPSAYMALDAWSSNHTEATFKAVGFLDYSTSVYYRGKVTQGMSLYDLAVDVFNDMGVTNYKIDVFLKKITTKNPLPIDLHKNCLQMIANAGLCSMFEDSNGTITLKSSIILPQYDISADNCEIFSNVEALLSNEEVLNFASADNNYAVTDGSLNFIEDITIQQPTGVVSHLYPTEDGLSITIQFEASWTFQGLSFIFSVLYPEIITIKEYNDNVLTGENDFTIDSVTPYLDHEFYEIDKLEISFSGVANNTRVHLDKIVIGSLTDYTIEEHDMSELPTATQTERIRNINVKHFEYIESSKRRTATTNADVGENLVTFDNPCYRYSLSYSNSVSGTLEVVESGAYYIIFTSTIAAKVDIKAYEYDKAENTYTIKLRENGQDITLENDLISDRNLAIRVAELFADYYGGDVEYDISYRGEPALECGDRVYLQNRFVNNNLILVTSEELSTSTGMSMDNRISARQISYTKG